jgi:hypothetical protein
MAPQTTVNGEAVCTSYYYTKPGVRGHETGFHNMFFPGYFNVSARRKAMWDMRDSIDALAVRSEN